MKIRFLGCHNVETSATGMSCLLVDDRLALDAGALTRNMSSSTMFSLEAILLTHGHFDHIRDLPSLGMNLYLAGKSIDVYGNQQTKENLTYCLLNGTMYSRFLEKPAEAPTFRYHVIEPDTEFTVSEYEILTAATPHSQPSHGYQVTGADGKKLFYTGDTGPGLADCFQRVSPDLLVTEVTAPSRLTDFFASKEGQHLTPELLKRELLEFRRLKGYLPEVACIHMSPSIEEEISGEIAELAIELNARIYLAQEGMTVTV
ncbi:metallo-beta-lactamase family protein [Dehalogenimonas lykanthroporepellens BL-DC-9]|jgi:ribonuclease BN (tRNA processing enzyme)|nr:metallo-beta-lactamase family protein [Dehalogenimonas lykanthroporepellens BL-DC-9]